MTPHYEVILDGDVAWTEITDDVLQGVNWNLGIQGQGPLDLTASSGQCSLGLRNDAYGGKALGRYSPGHAACLAGWQLGIPFRVRLTSGVTDYVRFRGKIRLIRPQTGQYGSRQAQVVAYDVMRDLAQAELRAVGVQVNAAEDDCHNAILAALPADVQPVATDFNAGVDTFPYALWDVGGGEKALGAINKVNASSFYMVAAKGDGTLIGRNRHSRVTGAVAHTFNANFLDLEAPSDQAILYDIVNVATHPLTVDAAFTTVLFALTGTVPVVSPGQTLTFWSTYATQDSAQRLIGAIPRSGPLLVSGTDYAGNSAIDGTGADLTTDLDVSASVAFGTAVKFVVENTGAASVYLIAPLGTGPLLQVRGKAIYDLGVQMFQPTGVSEGRISFDVDMPYQSSALIGQSAADFVYVSWATFLRQFNNLRFQGNQSAAKMLFALTVEPGDRIVLTEPVTGIAVLSALIQGVTAMLVEGVLEYVLTLIPTGPFDFWRWGVVGVSEWGTTTRYGF